SPIPVKLAKFAAEAIEKYLSGKCKSLDAAFGLEKKSGAPGWPKKRVKMAREIYKMWRAGKTMHYIARELKKQGYNDTERVTLKRILNEFKIRFMARDVADSLNHPDKDSPIL